MPTAPRLQEAPPLTAKLIDDAAFRWVVAHVRHYRPLNLKPTYWPGIDAAKLVALDSALEAGAVQSETYANGDTRFSVTDLGYRAIRAAVKAGAR